MAEIAESINKINSILLSRNTPVALVVGAAGFLGSHLVDKLLHKNIQVVGVDDLLDGKMQNLQKAAGNRNFHLVIESADKLEVDLPRLDYLFIVTSGNGNLNKILDLFKQTQCRCLLVSSIELYQKDTDEYKGLKEEESQIARFAEEHKLNARVLRLGPVYGPRMDFKSKDPLVRLIHQALTGNLQHEVSLEFSSRALYVADAVDLIVRTIFIGSTSQKIFDGVLPTPIKVPEIKQVLLDPVWYESRSFEPSELPPWPTPNLEKTIKILNWHPREKLVAGLRQTLSYFKDNEIAVPEMKVEHRSEEEIEKPEEKLGNWNDRKKAELEAFKGESRGTAEKKEKQKNFLPKFALPLSKIYLALVISLVTYALIWPGLVLGWGVLTFHYQLNEGLNNLAKGEFAKSLGNIAQANDGVATIKSIFDALEPIRNTGLFKSEFEMGDNLLNLSALSGSSAKSTVLGVQALLQGLKAVTGELTVPPQGYFDSAQVNLDSASEGLARSAALLKNPDFNKQLPKFLQQRVQSFAEKLPLYNRLVSKAQTMGVLLPQMVALNGSKNYLVLLQNNMELRPAGGFIGSFAKVSFEGGKLKKLAVNDIYAIDGQLNIHVEPPKEIKEDLGQKDWFLRDSNWESDFPTSARQAEWFYPKETGERVEGVIAIDMSAMEELLSVVGSLKLADYREEITAENLFEKAMAHAELSFFPGSQAKKSFLTALTSELFNKIFFLPQNNWPGIISVLGKSMDEKHISIYLNDPKLFSYVLSQNWAHILPRQSNSNTDFLSVVEANLGANKANYYLNRNYSLETVVGKVGEIKHRLRISYTNRSPSEAFPAGKYKNRMRVYLPFGSKLTRALWGEADITKDVTSFVDYGRSGYSLLLQLLPREQKTFILDYTVPVKLEFKDNKSAYRLDIVKQPGTLKDPFQWTITYPISYQVVSDQTKTVSPQEQTIQTDLSQDRSFEVQFSK